MFSSYTSLYIFTSLKKDEFLVSVFFSLMEVFIYSSTKIVHDKLYTMQVKILPRGYKVYDIGYRFYMGVKKDNV